MTEAMKLECARGTGGVADVARRVQHAEAHRDHAHRCQRAAAQHTSAAGQRGATLTDAERDARAARGWATAAWQAAAAARAAASGPSAAPRHIGNADDGSQRANAAAAAAHAAAQDAHRSACHAERQLSSALAAVLEQAGLAHASARLARSAGAAACLGARALRAQGLQVNHATWHLSRTRLHHRATLLDAERAYDAVRCVQAAVDVARWALQSQHDLPSGHRQTLQALATQLERAAADAECSMRQARRASDSAARAVSYAQLGLQLKQIAPLAERRDGALAHAS